MTDIAIRVERLAKKYRIGRSFDSFPTLRDKLAGVFGPQRQRGSEAEKWFWALRDVNFEVRRGEVLGVVGINGAGKSTLLKILSRIVEPTSGRVEIRGRVGCLLEVGTGFHPELTGRENVFLNAAILGMSHIETKAKFDEIVAFSGIDRFIDVPVKRYSSGMYLRLGFAVAAHIEPDILIVDEVLAVGDAAFQAKCMGKVGELVSEGRTVLLVSHQLPVVQKLCTRAILIRDGMVAANGAPHSVIGEHLRAMERWSGVAIETRTDRGGRGNARISQIDINGSAGPTLVCGGAACFDFHVDRNAEPMSCSFTIYDELGDGITSFDTTNPGSSDAIGREGARLFRCEIDALPLRPGRYRLNVALTSHHGVVEDHLEGACSFEVLPGLFSGREAISAPGYGRVEVAHRWISR